MRRTTVLGFGSLLLLVFVSAAPPAQAACLATGKSCLVGDIYDDSVCCPGMVCGWGAVCQAGCNIGGQFYRANFRNPENACQVCSPKKSTTSWTASCFVELFEPPAVTDVLVACMLASDPQPSDEFTLRTSAVEAAP